MPLDILEIAQKGPQPLDFIWDGFLAGSVGALVSPGGTGKSFWALEAAIAVAGGADLLDLKPNYIGRVTYLAAEDPEPVLTNRIYAILQYLSQKQIEIVAENLIIEPIMGKRLNLMREDHLKRIIEIYGDSRLIILDTISRLHTLDENSNSDMARLISTLEYMAADTGSTILFLHHTNKLAALAGMGDQQQAARGASALVDNIRWCAFLCKMTKEEANQYIDKAFGNTPIGEERRDFYLKFGVSKGNYAPPSEEKWFVREKGGVLGAITLESTVKKTKAKRWQNEE